MKASFEMLRISLPRADGTSMLYRQRRDQMADRSEITLGSIVSFSSRGMRESDDDEDATSTSGRWGRGDRPSRTIVRRGRVSTFGRHAHRSRMYRPVRGHGHDEDVQSEASQLASRYSNHRFASGTRVRVQATTTENLVRCTTAFNETQDLSRRRDERRARAAHVRRHVMMDEDDILQPFTRCRQAVARDRISRGRDRSTLGCRDVDNADRRRRRRHPCGMTRSRRTPLMVRVRNELHSVRARDVIPAFLKGDVVRIIKNGQHYGETCVVVDPLFVRERTKKKLSFPT